VLSPHTSAMEMIGDAHIHIDALIGGGLIFG
jgi:hypothetical protein